MANKTRKVTASKPLNTRAPKNAKQATYSLDVQADKPTSLSLRSAYFLAGPVRGPQDVRVTEERYGVPQPLDPITGTTVPSTEREACYRLSDKAVADYVRVIHIDARPFRDAVILIDERTALRTANKQRGTNKQVRARALLNLGIRELERGEWQKAGEYFNEALALDARNYEVIYGCAYSSLIDGSYSNAANFYERALTLKPTDMGAWLGLARARTLMNDIDGAFAACEKAFLINQHDAIFWIVQGLVYCVANKWDSAVSDFHNALAAGTADAVAHYYIATACFSKGLIDDAIEHFDEALHLGCDDAQLLFSRAEAWCARKEYHKALADFNEAVSKDPSRGVDYEGLRQRINEGKTARDLKMAVALLLEHINSSVTHTTSNVSMRDTRIDTIAQLLQGLTDALAADPAAAAALRTAHPDKCRALLHLLGSERQSALSKTISSETFGTKLIGQLATDEPTSETLTTPTEGDAVRDQFVSPSESASWAAHDLSEEQFTSSAIAAMSPDEFFNFFDIQFDKLAKPHLIETIQRWLHAQTGKNYGSLEENKKMASGVTSRLNILGLGVLCDNGCESRHKKKQDRTQVSRLRCVKQQRNKYEHGAFLFQTVGTNRLSHCYSSDVPPMKLAKLPTDRRKSE